MPKELTNTLPLRRKVDHAIELEPSAKPSVQESYWMTPLELEDLRKQLKQLLDVGYIQLSKAPYGALVIFQNKKDETLSTRPFWELTGFGVVGTPKLSELGARAILGWVTHLEVAHELPETKPCGQRGGPKADNIVLRRSRSRDVTIWYQSHCVV
ncbi:hypothetical protein L3X38_026152 [Prunus dulcis]|uniref:Uncharacterized protein n=1 Tax=Prunus dulcis TaxID=3755 RepID=A0AAD4W383_PRUDU|nr:hypothetical protein L3X38_026152 [Prunus dulcis]